MIAENPDSPGRSIPHTAVVAPPLRGAYDIAGAAYYLSMSRATLYRILARNELVAFRVGRLRLISRRELDRWIAEREAVEVV